MKFEKQGANVDRKLSPRVGILRDASDWVLLADLDSNYCFQIHIAFTQLRYYIAVFCNSLRKVLRINITYNCEKKHEIIAQHYDQQVVTF